MRRLGGEFANVGGSDYSYFELFKRLWAEQKDFLIVEHDIVPNDAAIASLARCNHLWCGCPYPISGQMAAYLGFTRFKAGLQRRVPNLLDRVAGLVMGDIRPHSWYRLDMSIAQILTQEEGCKMHIHTRHPVGHLKTYA